MCVDNLKHSYCPRCYELTFLNNTLPPPPHPPPHHHHHHHRGGSVVESLTRDKEVVVGTALCP